MKKIVKEKNKLLWVNKAKSFKDAKDFEDEYYISMSPEEKLSMIQFCREQYHNKLNSNENRKGFRRFLKIIK